jgi:2-iminobutanoate/2-iminopropanoate deaminase
MSDLPVPIATEDRPAPRGHYSMAVRHRGLIYVSGQLGLRRDGSHTAHLPFENQVRQAMQNLFDVLASDHLGPESLLKVTAYIVGVANWPAFDAIYSELMGAARPARSVVPVPELHYGYLVEIDAVAAGANCGGD